eukprot:4718718-Pleurochrysis_carterae.AAC.1
MAACVRECALYVATASACAAACCRPTSSAAERAASCPKTWTLSSGERCRRRACGCTNELPSAC